MGMTWLEFKNAVKELLTVDKDRRGVAEFIEQWIRMGALDVQRFVPYYRRGHETTFVPGDLETDLKCHRGNLGDDVLLTEAWIIADNSTDNGAEMSPGGNYPAAALTSTVTVTGLAVGESYVFVRGAHEFAVENGTDTWGETGTSEHIASASTLVVTGLQGQTVTFSLKVKSTTTDVRPVTLADWSRREEIRRGAWCVSGCDGGYISFDRQSGDFVVWPPVADGWRIKLVWQGRKLEFEDGDETPFDEEAAAAVSELVLAKIARKVKHDLAEHNSYMSTWRNQLKLLFIDKKN